MNSKMCGRGVRLGATVAVAGALALSLAGCGSSDETAQQLNASDETNASGVTVGACKTPEYYVADNANYQVKTPSESEISDIYTFTLEGKTFTLPCAASQLADAGWTPAGDLTVAAGRYWSAAAANGFTLEGAEGKTVGLHLVNTGAADASWKDCQVVGITVDGNSGVEFQTAAGVKVGDAYANVQKAYGATSYDIDNFGTLGYHFAAADASKDGARWYGQSVDALVVTPTNASLYLNWSAENMVYSVFLENFGSIAPTE